MPKTTGYSLWLMPERNTKTYSFLDQLIRNLAARYQTPIFNSHITLLGGINDNEQNVREKTQLLAEKLTPYEIQLDEIGTNKTYFQILFYKIKPTHSALNANDIARKVFGINKEKYFPHLSLAYGDLTSEQVFVLKQIVTQYNQISEICFEIKTIELWRTEGAVEKWRKIAIFPIKNLLNLKK